MFENIFNLSNSFIVSLGWGQFTFKGSTLIRKKINSIWRHSALSAGMWIPHGINVLVVWFWGLWGGDIGEELRIKIKVTLSLIVVYDFVSLYLHPFISCWFNYSFLSVLSSPTLPQVPFQHKRWNNKLSVVYTCGEWAYLKENYVHTHTHTSYNHYTGMFS